MSIKTQKPSIKALASELAYLKKQIGDDYRAFEDDDEPGMQVTLACDETGYALQTGDNSYHGSAYGHQHWAVAGLYRSSNSRDVAKELLSQVDDLVDGL